MRVFVPDSYRADSECHVDAFTRRGARAARNGWSDS